LGELFGVIRGRAALQDETAVLNPHAQVAYRNPADQMSLDKPFQFVSSNPCCNLAAHRSLPSQMVANPREPRFGKSIAARWLILPSAEFGPQDVDLIGRIESEPYPVPSDLDHGLG
jgi:hypothetical protein